MDKIVAVLDIYLDESGIHGSPACVAGGFAANSGDWTNWEREWIRVLKSFRVSVFHAKRFFDRGSKGERLDEYAGWTDEKGRQFVSELSSLIDLRRQRGFTASVCVVKVAAFNACNEHERNFLTGAHWLRGKWRFKGVPSRPHGAAFSFAVNSMLHKTEPTPVSIFHDEQRTYAPYLLKLHARVRQFGEWDGRIGPMVFGSKSEFVPIQAADLLVYSAYQRAVHGARLKNHEVGIVAEVLTRYPPKSFMILNEKTLPDILADHLPGEIRHGTTWHQKAKALKRKGR